MSKNRKKKRDPLEAIKSQLSKEDQNVLMWTLQTMQRIVSAAEEETKEIFGDNNYSDSKRFSQLQYRLCLRMTVLIDVIDSKFVAMDMFAKMEFAAKTVIQNQIKQFDDGLFEFWYKYDFLMRLPEYRQDEEYREFYRNCTQDMIEEIGEDIRKLNDRIAGPGWAVIPANELQ